MGVMSVGWAGGLVVLPQPPRPPPPAPPPPEAPPPHAVQTMTSISGKRCEKRCPTPKRESVGTSEDNRIRVIGPRLNRQTKLMGSESWFNPRPVQADSQSKPKVSAQLDDPHICIEARGPRTRASGTNVP